MLLVVGLNVFQRQADKLFMCNIAQTVNVLQSVLLAYENNCVRTTSYYAFLMQKPHRSKTAVRVATEDTTPLAWSVSASATAQLLSHADFNACNTFEKPNEVVPKQLAVSIDGSRLQLELAPISIAAVSVRLRCCGSRRRVRTA